jgi:hypothetical protein
MPVLYEHWRPDTNECFYIGISWAMEETRPYEMKDRNYRHFEVQKELYSKNMAVEVRVQKFESIEKEKLQNIEILMIAHWRQYIGKKLTNIHKGGFLPGGFEWDDEMRLNHSKLTKKFGHIISKSKIKYWSNPENVERQRKTTIDFYQTEYGKNIAVTSGKKHSVFMKAFLSSDKGKKMLKIVGQKIREHRASDQWHIKDPNFELKISTTLKNFAKTEEGRESYKKRAVNISKAIEQHYKTEKGKAQAIYQAWWNSNVRFQKYWGA